MSESKSNEGQPQFRRRNWLVDPMLQGRYLLHLLAISGLVGLTIAAIVAHTTSSGTPPEELSWLERLGAHPIGMSLFTVAFIMISTVFLSHRIAGPAYRLRRSAEDVSRGDMDFRIKLRRYDHLGSAADAFNTMMDSLQERDQESKKRRAEVCIAVRLALEKLQSSEQSEMPEALRLLEEAGAQLQESDPDDDDDGETAPPDSGATNG